MYTCSWLKHEDFSQCSLLSCGGFLYLMFVASLTFSIALHTYIIYLSPNTLALKPHRKPIVILKQGYYFPLYVGSGGGLPPQTENKQNEQTSPVEESWLIFVCMNWRNLHLDFIKN